MNQPQYLRQAKSIVWLPEKEDTATFNLVLSSKTLDCFFVCKAENGRLVPNGVAVLLAKSRTVSPGMPVLQIM